MISIMPPTGFNDPIYPVFAKKALARNYDGWNAWTRVRLEVAECRSCLPAGLVRFGAREKRVSIDADPSSSPSNCVWLVHVQTLNPSSGEKRVIQSVPLPRLCCVEGPRG
jgi:hypothetical protein